tara:strand:+ start:684 stop:1631 length:948 start_codon:yes stop_codon:yes gene_type:complete
MKKMSTIIKYCDDLEYFNGNLYLDSFQENIYGALSVIGMKKDFNPEEDQIIVSSQNADIPKLKNFLINEGIKEERIIVVEDIKDIPFSYEDVLPSEMIEHFYEYIEIRTKEHFKESYKGHLGRMFVLFNKIMLDLNDTNYNINEVEDFEKLKSKEEFVKTREGLSILESDKYFENKDLKFYFEMLNKTIPFLKLEKKMDFNKCYIFKPKTLIEEVFISRYLRCYSKYKTKGFIRETESKNKKYTFVDFENFISYGYLVMPSQRRDDIQKSVFLNKDTYDKGNYDLQGVACLFSNAFYIYCEKESYLKKDYYYKRF